MCPPEIQAISPITSPTGRKVMFPLLGRFMGGNEMEPLSNIQGGQSGITPRYQPELLRNSPTLNAWASQSGITPQYQPMSPLGSPQGTQAPERAQEYNQQDLEAELKRQGTSAVPAKRRVGPWERLGQVGGILQAGQQGAQMFQQQPQQGMGYRPQQVYSEEFTQGPLSRGILDDYLRSLSANQGISY